jgi:hypothetical protein
VDNAFGIALQVAGEIVVRIDRLTANTHQHMLGATHLVDRPFLTPAACLGPGGACGRNGGE